ncbi:MAG: acyl-CoA dehydrogenase family protein [Vicinamibacterales bacterium]
MVTTTTIRSLQDLLPTIHDRRQEIERERRLPRDLVESLRRTGMFTMGVPRSLGGTEASPIELMAAAETVASADGSTGWCAMVGTANGISAGYMPAEGAREVFADPTRPTAGIAAPIGAAVRENGGVRVNGRWPFGSGITHCDWLWAGCLLMEGGQPVMTPHGPEMLHVWIPVKDVTIHDTWQVSGLCGTGSHDFTVKDVLVPDERTFRLLDPAGHWPEPLYQMPPLGLFVYQVAAVALGIARGALDELADLVQAKKPSLYEEPIAERPMTQIDLARAEGALGSARAFLLDQVGALWQTVSAGHAPASRQIALARIASTQAVETAATVTRTASTLGGGTSLFLTSALQQRARDAEALTHHFTVAPHTWEQAGRVLLGRQPGVPAF